MACVVRGHVLGVSSLFPLWILGLNSGLQAEPSHLNNKLFHQPFIIGTSLDFLEHKINFTFLRKSMGPGTHTNDLQQEKKAHK